MTVPGAGRLASPLGIGLAVMYMSVIVLIPFAALLNGAFENGWDSFWRAITNPQAMSQCGAYGAGAVLSANPYVSAKPSKPEPLLADDEVNSYKISENPCVLGLFVDLLPHS